jgi:hypothetical protein
MEADLKSVQDGSGLLTGLLGSSASLDRLAADPGDYHHRSPRRSRPEAK